MQSTALGAVVVEALELAFWLSMPALLASFVAGAVSGLLQGATQIQDPALGFVPRLLAVAAALLASYAWMSERLLAFARQVLHGLGS
jgi:type III secretory pathway component EscS